MGKADLGCEFLPRARKKKKTLIKKVLRVHPRKDQAGAAQPISPISMKLGQFEGIHPKLLLSKFKEIWSKPRGVDHPLCFLAKMTKKSPNNWSKV